MLITQNGEAKLVVMDVRSYEEQEATLALLKILALGNREIEQGHFLSANDVFASWTRKMCSECFCRVSEIGKA